MDDLGDEAVYDATRLEQLGAGHVRQDGMTRRRVLGAVGAASLAGTALPALAGRAQAETTPPGPIIKPLPTDEFYVYGSNAETRWEVLRDKGYFVTNEQFFVRDHSSTPLIDATSWTLSVFGTGLRNSPTAGTPVRFNYEQLRRLPARTVVSFIECAGNGRSFFATQQSEVVAGTAWKLGAIGVAAWRGVPLSLILERAGLTRAAVDVMPYGLDPDYVTGGVNYGQVRRPIPVEKALDDVILAYEMNGEPLPPDSGFPVRAIVPQWAGIANIKWVGQIEVSATPLVSYWNTQAYRRFAPSYPADGTLVTRQVVKSAFELEWGAQLPARKPYLLTGRSWSGHGPIAHTEISTDGGKTWHHAVPRDSNFALPDGWQLWEYPWVTPAPGTYHLQARATDITGRTQPVTAVYNTGGYLYDGIVQHPVTTA